MKRTYHCPSCDALLAEEGSDSVGVTCLVCVKCGRVAGLCWETPNPDVQIEGQTTIDEYLDYG